MLFVACGRPDPASGAGAARRSNPVQTIRKFLSASFSQIRTRLLLVVVLAVIPALVLTLYVGIKQKRQAAEQANREFLNVTKMVASEQERVLNGAKQLLGVLVHLPEVRSLEPVLCDPLLASLLKSNPLYANFGVVDRNGMLLCSALPFSHPINDTDRMWFRRAVETRAFAVGDYVVSRTAHFPTLNCGCPFFDDDGNILGVAFAALDLKWESQLLAGAHLPEGTVATLLDSSGNILARSADSEKWIGQSVADTPFIHSVLTRRESGTAESPGIDGVIRLYAFTPLKESGGSIVGYLILGIPPDMAYAASNRMMVRSLLFLGVVGAFAVFAAWVFAGTFVLRRTRDLVAAANRLRAGDLTSRTGPDHQFGEFSNLAIAFDEMADALERHRDHLEQLVATRTAELKEVNEELSADITERKVAEEALRKALANLQKSHEQLKASQMLLINAEKLEITGRLAAGVAHEVKNPLAILALSLDYLARVLPDRDENVADVLKDMRDAIRRADTIILGLLDFSASEKLKLQPGDLNSVIEKATLLVRHNRKSSRVELVKNLAPDLPPVAIDQNKAVQALVNLFSNSIDAMPDGGTLTVSSYFKQPVNTAREAGTKTSGQSLGEATIVVVEIHDSGSGIPPEKLSKIFDPFFTTKPPGKGTGLGLTVTRKIIELHGGSLQITNKQEGGARALLLFPALKAK